MNIGDKVYERPVTGTITKISEIREIQDGKVVTRTEITVQYENGGKAKTYTNTDNLVQSTK